MVEKQINVVLLLSQGQPVLTTHKAEAVAEFEKERLQAGDQAVFEFAFLNGAAEVEEFQVVRALHHFVGLLGEMLRQDEGEVVSLLHCYRTFIRSSLNLVEEDIATPAKLGSGTKVVQMSGGNGDLVEDQQVLPPGYFCDKLSQNLTGLFRFVFLVSRGKEFRRRIGCIKPP